MRDALDRRIRVMILCCDGFWQRILIREVAARFELTGIVFCHFSPPSRSWNRYLRYLGPRTVLRHFVARRAAIRWAREAEPIVRRLSRTDGAAPEPPAGVPTLHVANVNLPEAVEFVRERRPDLVCINGTNLLRRSMLELIPEIPLGMINLHTGLSPYSRGGNCNLFMLLEGRPEMVGVTVHHIDPGIDSGDIIRTARPRLEPDDTIETIDAKIFRLGIDLMMESIADLSTGRAQRVPQWTEGKLFLRRTGYAYSPWQRMRVNRRMEEGLVRDYLADQVRRDRDVRMVEARS